jgi:hypothetical protein
MTATALPPARRRFWPKTLAGKALATFIYALLLLVVLWFAALFAAQQRLDRAIAEARTHGYTESWEELVGPPIPDEENAAIPLSEAGKLVEKTLDQFKATRAQLDRDPSLLAKAAAPLVDDEQYERLMNEAAARPRYRSLVESSDADAILRKKLDAFFEVARMESATAQAWTAAGKREEAGSRMLRLLRLTRVYTTQELFPLAQGIGHEARIMASRRLNELLRNGEFAMSFHDELESELAKHESVGEVGVRGMYGGLRWYLPWSASERPLLKKPVLNPFALANKTYVFERYNALASTIREPYKIANPIIDVRNPLRNPVLPFLGNDESTLHYALDARQFLDRSLVHSRCLRIINAMAKKKNFAADLDSLGLPAECLVDPMNGERLRVNQTPDGPIVYSVGGDLNDDGGRIDAPNAPYDVGFGPAKAAAKK